ncbi:hypothetical protein HDV04_002580 [Boothiomyces sp. JEL0838]|nr:hypothetical protein HDV04_002580 [Boothiomyces sp. JEL0838]
MVVKIQQKAPHFSAQAVVNGEFKEVSLDDYKGKYLVLFFYPLDWTFVCPTEIIAFSEKAAEFRKINTEVVGVSIDSKFSHFNWINQPRKQGGLGEMHIPLLADVTKKISRDYGVLIEEGGDAGLAARGTFIIDDKQNVRVAQINDLPIGRNIDEVYRLVEAIQFHAQHGEVCCLIGKIMESDLYQEQINLSNSIHTEGRKKPSPFYICIPGLFYVLAMSMTSGIIQQWLMLYLCARFDHLNMLEVNNTAIYLPGFYNSPVIHEDMDWSKCRTNTDIQVLAVRWVMIIRIFSALSIVVGPLYGFLSDRIGRKPIIILALTASLISFTAYITVDLYGYGLWVLLLASFVEGWLGGVIAIMNATISYFADCSEAEERGKTFIVGEAILFGGIAFGPLIGGAIFRTFDNGSLVVFSSSVIVELLVITYAIFFLPESLDFDQVPESEVNSISDVISSAANVFTRAKSTSFIILLVVHGIMTLAHSSTLFFQFVSFKFGWDSQDEGQYVLISAVSRMVNMGLLYPLILKICKTSSLVGVDKVRWDLSLIKIGLAIIVSSTIGKAITPVSGVLYILTVFDGFGTLAGPTLRSLISISVPSGSQGTLFSGISFMDQIISLFGGILYPNIWQWTVKTFPECYFFVMAFFYILGISLVFILDPARITRASEREEYVGLEDYIDLE